MTMVAHAMPFAYVAESVAHRAANLLAATVSVVDENEVVVARAAPRGSESRHGHVAGDTPDLRVPIRLQGLSGHVVASGPNEPISPRLAEALIELVVTQAAGDAELPSQDDLRGRLVRDLLAAHALDDSRIAREAQILGMDLSRPRAAIVIQAAEYVMAPAPMAERSDDSPICRRARDVIGHVVRFFNLPNATICAYLGDGEVVILKASSSRDLAPWSVSGQHAESPVASWTNLPAQKRAGQALLDWLERQTGTSMEIGIGRHHAGIAGLARSYQDARAALVLGGRLGSGKRVYCLDDLGAAAFVGLSDERTKLELAVRLLGPLDPEPDLLATLNAFFEENCSPSMTAKRLAIHRNTLGYRLDKIASLSGLDPRRFDDAVQIRLALLLRRVAPEASWPVAS